MQFPFGNAQALSPSDNRGINIDEKPNLIVLAQVLIRFNHPLPERAWLVSVPTELGDLSGLEL